MSSSAPTRFNEAHSDKPDPEEPWRYVCPDCHGQVSEWGGLKYKCSSCGKRPTKTTCTTKRQANYTMSLSDTFDRIKPSEKINEKEYHSLFEWERSEK